MRSRATAATLLCCCCVLVPALAAGGASAAGTTGAAGAAAAARGATCRRAGSQTLAGSATARVFLVEGRDDDLYGPPSTVYGCLRRHPRPVVLQRFSAGSVPSVTGRRLAGRYVALAETVISTACTKYMGPAPECSSALLRSYDLRSGRRRATGAAPVAAFVLSPSGWLAWVTPPDPLGLAEVAARDASGLRSLGRGAVDPRSLTLRDGLLSWTQDGAAASAPLR